MGPLLSVDATFTRGGLNRFFFLVSANLPKLEPSLGDEEFVVGGCCMAWTADGVIAN